MTIAEAINGARDLLKDSLATSRTMPDDSSSFFTDTEMLRWLNWTQLDIQKRLIDTFENWLVTTTQVTLTANVEELAMPSGCIKIVRAEDVTNTSAPIEIHPINFNDKDSYNYWYQTQITQVGQVDAYAIYGNRLIFRPRPSTATPVRFYYCKALDDCDFVSASNTASLIPVQYHEMLVWGMVKRAMVKQEATAEALTVANAEYNNLMTELTRTAENRQVQRPRFIRRRRQ